jgi:phosphatidylglycerol:prolipoprotein diacylglycerol transferase
LVNGVVRHPTQLYEAFLEGLVLFIILWVFTARKRSSAFTVALFLICYGCFRFFIEYFRLPDDHIGYLAWGWLTVGQILSIPMLVIGFYILFSSKIRKNT